jgi:hypothetical protein
MMGMDRTGGMMNMWSAAGAAGLEAGILVSEVR